jgi:hypothetical protein
VVEQVDQQAGMAGQVAMPPADFSHSLVFQLTAARARSLRF